MGCVKVTAPITEEYSIKQIPRWVLFTTENNRDRIYNDSVNAFSDTIMITVKDISGLSTDFGGSTEANGKIKFCMCRTKREKRTISLGTRYLRYLRR